MAFSDTGQTIAIQTNIDTSFVQTTSSGQSGTPLLCASASASGTTYTCALSPTLTSYTVGMLLHWTPDLDGAGGATTINIDALGQVAVKLADGTTDPAPGDLVAARMAQLWWDGAVFRLLDRSVPAGVLGEIRPSCAASLRGRLWFVAGGVGVQDGLSVCAKDAMDTLAWRTIY